MVLRDVEPSQPGSSRLTEVPGEYLDLREANRDHIRAQNAVPGAELVGHVITQNTVGHVITLRPFTRSWKVLSDHVTIRKNH